MHFFKYSRRDGTKSATMPNQIAPNIQEERSKKLISLSNKNQQIYNESYVGKTVQVLFEEASKGYIKGHTQNYLVVNIKEDIEKFHNQIVPVKITSILGEELIGNAVI